MKITMQKNNVVKVVDNEEAATKLLSRGFQEVDRDESSEVCVLDETEYNATIKKVAEEALEERLSEYEKNIKETVEKVTQNAVEKVEGEVASQIEALNTTAEEAKKSLMSSKEVAGVNPSDNSSTKTGKKSTTSKK